MSVAGEVTDTSIMEVGRSRPQFQYSRVWCTFTIRLYKIFSLFNTLFIINLLNRKNKYICCDKLFILLQAYYIKRWLCANLNKSMLSSIFKLNLWTYVLSFCIYILCFYFDYYWLLSYYIIYMMKCLFY